MECKGGEEDVPVGVFRTTCDGAAAASWEGGRTVAVVSSSSTAVSGSVDSSGLTFAIDTAPTVILVPWVL